MRTDEPKQAQEAFEEFYSRHVEYLYGACKRFRAYGLPQSDVVDIVQATFVRVFEKAGTFRPPPERRGAAEDRAWVRGWLGTIAFRILTSSFRRSPKLVLVENSDLDKEESPTIEESAQVSPRVKLIQEALSQLTEREREVLLVSYAWYEPGKQLTIPEEDLKRLATDYATTAANLRQIRLRAKKKIEDYLNQHERQS